MQRRQRVFHPYILAILQSLVLMASRRHAMKPELTEQGKKNFFNQFILGAVFEVSRELVPALQLRWCQRTMWIRYLRDGVRGDVPKLPDAMLIAERLPALTSQYNIQRGECLASIRVLLLSFALVKHCPDDSEESIGWNGGARVRHRQHFLQACCNPRPSSRTVV